MRKSLFVYLYIEWKLNFRKATEEKSSLESNLEDVIQQIEQMQQQNIAEKGEKLEQMDEVSSTVLV